MKLSARKLKSYQKAEEVCRELRFLLAAPVGERDWDGKVLIMPSEPEE